MKAVKLFQYFCYMVAGAVFFNTAPVAADTIRVAAGENHLVQALSQAQAGDKLILTSGVHFGPIIVSISTLVIEGEEGAIIKGNGEGHVIHVAAPDVTIKGLNIKGSGIRHETLDSAVFLDKTAVGAQIITNNIEDSLVGVYIWGAKNSLVEGNIIKGRTDLRMNERGNGVYVWNAPGSKVMFNDISGGRDGIFVNISHHNVFEGNRMRNLRFAIHYMYANNSIVRNNLSENNDAGYAIMHSTTLEISGNISRNDKNYGLMFNYTNAAKVTRNKVIASNDKCVFIYNSHRNEFTENWFEGCQIGIHFTGGSERNSMSGSSFIANRTQVKYVGNKWVEWSVDGVGNYWSDNPSYDLNGDGFADIAYKPNDIVDQVMWRYPMAKTLITSPAIKLLRWAQGQFPALRPGGVVDSFPLMEATRLPENEHWSNRGEGLLQP